MIAVQTVTLAYHWLGLGALACVAVGFILAIILGEAP